MQHYKTRLFLPFDICHRLTCMYFIGKQTSSVQIIILVPNDSRIILGEMKQISPYIILETTNIKTILFTILFVHVNCFFLIQ